MAAHYLPARWTPRDHHQMKNQQGFTLIEVLIASAILIMSIGTLLQLFTSGLDRNQRIAQYAHLLTAQRTIAARLDQINPAQQQKGDGTAESLNYQWQAKITEPYQVIYEAESDFPRELALYSITVELDKPRGGTHEFEIQQIGWRDKK